MRVRIGGWLVGHGGLMRVSFFSYIFLGKEALKPEENASIGISVRTMSASQRSYASKWLLRVNCFSSSAPKHTKLSLRLHTSSLRTFQTDIFQWVRSDMEAQAKQQTTSQT
jgi:hypothetical protein